MDFPKYELDREGNVFQIESGEAMAHKFKTRDKTRNRGAYVKLRRDGKQHWVSVRRLILDNFGQEAHDAYENLRKDISNA
jgi:hypothetical protein